MRHGLDKDVVNPTLRAAREYLERSWSILPVGADKRPLVKWGWLQHEHPKPEMVDRWFADGKSGVGIVCGRISGLMVLDVEANGLPYFRDLPSTLMVLSQNFGAHYYFQYTDRDHHCYLRREGEHVADLRGDGGYVVAPPTRGTSGRRYRWMNAEPVAPLPDEFLIEPSAPMCPWKGQEPTTDLLKHNAYTSRSERLMAIARKVVAEGGDFVDVKKVMLADRAGAKVREKGKHADKWIYRHVEKAREFLGRGIQGEVLVARVVGVSKSSSELGERITVKLDLGDGRIVRQGVTLLEDNPRTEAFRRALPHPQSGDTVRVEVFQTAYGGRPIWRVRRFLTEEDDSHESQT